MSVVGLDVGNENCIVAVARQRGIDIVLNDESKAETPAIVSFGEKQRFIGTAGSGGATLHPKNTISQIKRLVGRRFSDPEVQQDLHLLPFSVVEGPDGGPLINVQYLNERRSFTPTQILAVVLSNLKVIAEKNLGVSVFDCVIGIPVFFTELQRRAYLDAASIAGLRPLRLMHETAATALAYGIYKTDLPESEPINVVFVDVGHASMQVCVVAYKKGQLKILGSSFDRSLGGRDFDEVLFNYFGEKFVDEYKIDVWSNVRASQRLRTACEKVKKILSANPEAPLNVECLMDEKDVRGFIKREEFERLAAPILERVKGPCEKALAESQLTVDKISAVEVVGSGSRVPAILKIVAAFFGKEPGHTLNASECIARGCALQCAMLSPTFRVRDFQVQDSFPFPIALSWKDSDAGDETASDGIVFEKGSPVPYTKILTVFRSGTFIIDAFYADTSELPPGTPAKISSFQIGPFSPSNPSGKGKLDVKFRLNLHGILSVDSSTLVEGEETQAPKVREVPVHELVFGGLPPPELQRAQEKEFEMALQDRVMEETKDKKNAVEAYVYDMRNKLHEKLADYVTPEEREELSGKLQTTEDWLYEDGEDETKGVYVAKLAELKKLGDPIDERQKEDELRGPAILDLRYCINSFRQAAESNDSKYDHIDATEKAKVVTECSKAEEWLKEKKQFQDSLPKTANPVFHAADIKRSTENLDRYCKQIMTKRRPTPPKPATTVYETRGPESEDHPPGSDTPTTEPMETEAPPSQEAEPVQTE